MKIIASVRFVILIALPFALAVSPTHAQTISIGQVIESVYVETAGQYDETTVQDAGPEEIDGSSTNGTFNQNLDQTVSGALGSAHGYISQNTTVTPTATNLTVTGTFISTNISNASTDDMGDMGVGGTLPEALFTINFYTDQPFNYSLTVSISRDMEFDSESPIATYSAAYLEFGNSGSLNVTYGYSSPAHNGWPDGTYPATGTSSGILPAGISGMQVVMDNSATFNSGPNNRAGDYSYNSTSSMSFTLTISPLPPALAPVITSFVPAAAGSYELDWTASQDGDYRIDSSPDLVNWTEAVASDSYSAGANVNTVDALPDSPAGFYRVVYLGPSSP